MCQRTRRSQGGSSRPPWFIEEAAHELVRERRAGQRVAQPLCQRARPYERESDRPEPRPSRHHRLHQRPAREQQDRGSAPGQHHRDPGKRCPAIEERDRRDREPSQHEAARQVGAAMARTSSFGAIEAERLKERDPEQNRRHRRQQIHLQRRKTLLRRKERGERRMKARPVAEENPEPDGDDVAEVEPRLDPGAPLVALRLSHRQSTLSAVLDAIDPASPRRPKEMGTGPSASNQASNSSRNRSGENRSTP